MGIWFSHRVFPVEFFPVEKVFSWNLSRGDFRSRGEWVLFSCGVLIQGAPGSSPLERIGSYHRIETCREALRQGRCPLGTGSPALRPLSELLDIVVQLLIVGCTGIGQPFAAVAKGSPDIRRLPPSQGARSILAPSTPAGSTHPLLDVSWPPELASSWISSPFC